MTQPPPLQRGRALLWLGIASGLAIVGLALALDEHHPLLTPGPGEWIQYPHAIRTSSHPERDLEAVFTRELPTPLSGSEHIVLRCLGECEYEPLVRGASELRVVVRRTKGPPAMALELRDGGSVVLESDRQWLATLNGATTLPARLAREPRRPAEVAASIAADVDAPMLFALAMAALAAAVAWGRFRSPALRRSAIGIGVGATWTALWWKSAGIEPGFTGFDYAHHLHYVRFILGSGALPLPSDGVQTYQPPLFYLLSVVWLKLFGLGVDAPQAPLALRALTFLLGLVNLAGVAAAVRQVLPGRAEAAQLTVLFVAAVPVHLLMMHAFANEVALAAASTWTLVALLRAMSKPTPSHLDGAAVGLLLGAALMSKLSALVLVPVAIGGLVAAHPRRSRVWGSALVASAFVSGGYYLRIAAEYGTPFVGNWDPGVGFAWWQDPGLRSLGDYFRFGAVFSNPYFAGFESVWDGLYSTLFADGLASGASSRLLGPSWNDGLVGAVLLLSLVPALTLGVGLGASLLQVSRRPTLRGLVLAALLVGMAAAFVAMTLRVPSYAQAKASYWSPVFAVLAVAFAVGADRILGVLRARSAAMSTAYLAALFLWAFASTAMFWTDDRSSLTLHSRAERALASGAPQRALGYVGQMPELPDEAWVEVARCRAARMEGRMREARSACDRALERYPNDPGALFHSATLERAAGEPERALGLLERMVEVAPEDPRAAPQIASLAAELGRADRLENAAREMLRFEPGSPSALAALRSAAAQ